MRTQLTRRLAFPAVIAVALTAMTMTGAAAQAAPRAPNAATVRSSASPAYTTPPGVIDPCPPAAPDDAGCATLTSAASASSASKPAAELATAAATPAGLSPANLQQAYELSSSLGSGQTVAVVTAFNDPDAESDLAAYRSEYGLAACTVANGCFKQVSQTGSTTVLPGTSAGWTAPVAESTDMISAICPNCHILVVDATNSGITDLGTAENEAVTLGAKFIDNDWFLPEAELGPAETTYDTEYFDHPGVAITAPAGDDGYGVIDYPAASQYVTAVGGTTLTADSSARGYTETAWADTGSGCSAFEPRPSWQPVTDCAGRTLNDTAADAGTPVAYYDTPAEGGWGQGTGTTVAAAIVAAAYALAGTPAPGSYPASYLYSHPGALWPITSGSNGTCSESYLCTAGPGYNGPTGEGTPDGYAAFNTQGAKPTTVTATNGATWVFATTDSGGIEADSLPSGSTKWSGLTSLGGGPWSGYPTALAGADGSIWVFALSGGDLYADQLPAGSTTWSGWNDLGSSGVPMVGQGVPTEDNSGNIWVFMRDSVMGNVYADELPSRSATWTGFTVDLGGDLPDNIAATVGAQGYMSVLGISNDGTLYQDVLPPGGSWTGWTEICGAGVIGAPVIVQDNSGTYHAYARRSADGAMMTCSEPSTWSSLSSIGGTWTDNPTALVGSGGDIWVFAIDPGGDVEENALTTAGTWIGWTNVGSGFAGVPGFSEDGSGIFHVFAVSTGGALEVNSQEGGGHPWTGWTTLGSSFAGS